MDRNSYHALYTRVSAWNSLRYAREFNLSLRLSLLSEEIKETNNAKAPVDILDGRCDQAYVALGSIWKLNLSEDDIECAFGEAGVTLDRALASGLSLSLEDIDVAIALNLNALRSPALALAPRQQAAVFAMICLLNHVAVEREFGVDFYEAMHIVCDANDSKVVQKAAPDVKANIDKGLSFVPPEARLQALLDEVQNVKH